MKNIKEMHEFLLTERRAAADRLLKDVVKGNASEVEGIKLSKEMADAFLMWLKQSTYGKKFGALPFDMLFTAAFNWGLDRYIGKDKKIKDEFKELKVKAKEMSKQQKMKAEDLEETSGPCWDGYKIGSPKTKISSKSGKRVNNCVPIDEKRSSPFGEIMLDIDAASKKVKLPMAWMKDYVKSIERMAKKGARKFFKDYGSFSVDDWVEDMEYNFANESKVSEKSDYDPYKNADDIFFLWDDIVNDDRKGIEHSEVAGGSFDGSQFSFDDRAKGFKKFLKQLKNMIKKEGWKHEFMGDEVLNLMEESESVTEARAKKVTKQMWKRMNDDKRFDALLSVVKDPDEAEKHVEDKWEDLPSGFERDMVLFEKDYSAEERDKLASKGLALPDGRFPIKNIEDLKNAILSYGRSKDHSQVAKFIAKRARALGAEDLIPDTENFQKALRETEKGGKHIPFYESFKKSFNEAKKPKGAPDFHHSDAPDAEGRFKDLSIKDLAAWLIKTRKKDLKKISGSLTQQVVFNRNDDKAYADKMEKTRLEVYKQLGREDLLDKKD